MSEDNYGYAEILSEDESKIVLGFIIGPYNIIMLPYTEMHFFKKNINNEYDIVKMSEDWFHITLYQNLNYPEIHIEAFKKC